jgi:cytochrome c oxidase subunit 2
VSIWSSLGFQDGCSFFIEQLLFFHDHSMLVLIVVSSVVMYYCFCLVYAYGFSRLEVGGHELEFIWTLVPSFLLIFIAFPSLKILYIIDDLSSGAVTFKSVGYQ